METLYRKEQILNIVDRCFHMYASDYRNDARMSATEMLEEIPETIKSDNTQTLENALQQIERLEGEKKELMEALEIFIEENTPIATSHAYEFPKYMMKAKSLIQKHKQ